MIFARWLRYRTTGTSAKRAGMWFRLQSLHLFAAVSGAYSYAANYPRRTRLCINLAFLTAFREYAIANVMPHDGEGLPKRCIFLLRIPKLKRSLTGRGRERCTVGRSKLMRQLRSLEMALPPFSSRRTENQRQGRAESHSLAYSSRNFLRIHRPITRTIKVVRNLGHANRGIELIGQHWEEHGREQHQCSCTLRISWASPSCFQRSGHRSTVSV